MIRSKFVLVIAVASTCALVAAAFTPIAQDMGMPQPTDEHKHMLAGAGEWEGTLTSYAIPGVKPEPVAAREAVTAIGGFWVLSDFHCTFMGQPYHGSGHYGYDAEKKKYIGTWVDSMSSQLALMEGELDAKTKTLVMRWQAPDMMSGKIVPQRSEGVENGDSRTTTFFSGEGAGTKSMVIEMKRKGSKATEAGAKK